MAAPCPPTLKEQFINWLGPKIVRELYAGTEAQAATNHRGSRMARHRGSVGRVLLARCRFVTTTASRCPQGRSAASGCDGVRTNRRRTGISAQNRCRHWTVWETLGDVGWMDEENFLYLADRDSDMILVGGSNVYPAEVEAALLEHPSVRDACVIGLPDEDLGAVPRALLQVTSEVADNELARFLRSPASTVQAATILRTSHHELRG